MTEINNEYFGREDIIQYIKELGRTLKKEYGAASSFEIIIVGGASIVLNYQIDNRRTRDIDYFKNSISSINSCIRTVQNKFGLNSKWMNDDFITTNSFSSKLRINSVYFGTFSHVLKVYTVKDTYLTAMKFVSFRDKDIEDIINVSEQANLDKEEIKKAILELYGNFDLISKEGKLFLENIDK